MEIVDLGRVLGPNVNLKFTGEMLFMADGKAHTRALFNPKTGFILEFDSVEPELPDATNADEVA